MKKTKYVKSYESYLKESEQFGVPRKFADKIEVLQKRAENYTNSPTQYKLKIALNSDFNSAFNVFLDSMEYKRIYDKFSIEAGKFFNENFKEYMLPLLKATYYYFSQGKFTDLNKISFEEFLNIYNKELDSIPYNDLIQNFSNRIKIADQASENIFKEVANKQ